MNNGSNNGRMDLLISLLFPFMKRIAIKYNATELAWEFIQDEG